MSLNTYKNRRFFARAMLCSGALTGLLVLTSMYQGFSLSDAWIIKKKTAEIPWKVISQDQIERGASIPPDTNVVFYLPGSFERITRSVLFGTKGDEFRYWGYCIPENYDSTAVQKRTGFPGILFLSEAEREYRLDLEARHKPQFSIFNLPSNQDIEKTEAKKTNGVIRHQLEIFTPNLVCYIMTSMPLSIGLDPDEDGLNTKLELDALTDPTNPDTDGDGVLDGAETFHGTNGLIQDTDGDNLIDGLEDKNGNGRIDYGESNPRKKDSDLDGLCDGSCRMDIGKGQIIYYGEDNNLSGTVDEHETSPISNDTNLDGVTDYQAFFNCMVGEQEYCL